MDDLRISRLIINLQKDDFVFISKNLQKEKNKIFFSLLNAFKLLKEKNVTREEIFLRVYKKKWTQKLDASFRTDMSRLADLTENLLIHKRLKTRIETDKTLFEEEKLKLYIDCKLNKEAIQQYDSMMSNNLLDAKFKNDTIDFFADFVIKNNLAIKEKLLLIENNVTHYKKNLATILELQQAKSILLKCIFNYYYKQTNNHFFEKIDTSELLEFANNLDSIEAKFYILNGISYLKIDSNKDDISIKIYEQSVQYAQKIVAQNPSFIHNEIKSLHLLGTRYSILGNFKKGNIYFEEAIQKIPTEQYKNYKTLILNFATNCTKIKNFKNALELIKLLDNEALNDSKLKTECNIRSLSCYLFMDDATAIHQLVITQSYHLMQPHEKIYFRLCQCNAFVIENELEHANTEINNLVRSKLLQEIDTDFLPATQLIAFMINCIYKNGKIKLNDKQKIQFIKLQSDLKIDNLNYLQHYSPYLWLLQKLDIK